MGAAYFRLGDSQEKGPRPCSVWLSGGTQGSRKRPVLLHPGQGGAWSQVTWRDFDAEQLAVQLGVRVACDGWGRMLRGAGTERRRTRSSAVLKVEEQLSLPLSSPSQQELSHRALWEGQTGTEKASLCPCGAGVKLSVAVGLLWAEICPPSQFMC